MTVRASSGAYQRLGAWHGELTAFRRDLHAHPEIGFQEKRTAQRVVAALRESVEYWAPYTKTGFN